MFISLLVPDLACLVCTVQIEVVSTIKTALLPTVGRGRSLSSLVRRLSLSFNAISPILTSTDDPAGPGHVQRRPQRPQVLALRFTDRVACLFRLDSAAQARSTIIIIISQGSPLQMLSDCPVRLTGARSEIHRIGWQICQVTTGRRRRAGRQDRAEAYV